MYLKRMFDHSSGVPEISHIKMLRASKEFHFGTKMIEKGMAEGWLSMGDGKIVLKTAPGEPDVVYKILRTPGVYCCHDGKKMDDSLTAREYIARKFPGVKSPDPENPSGYERIHYYDTVLEG